MHQRWTVVVLCGALGCGGDPGSVGASSDGPESGTDGSSGEAGDDSDATDSGGFDESGPGADEDGTTSSPPVCGDGVVDADLGEACDDGNQVEGDGCELDCTVSGGTLLWSHANVEQRGIGRDVAVSPSGQTVMAGQLWADSSSNTALVRRMTARGTEAMAVSYAAEQTAYGVAVDAEDNIIVVGPAVRCYIAKLDTNGDEIWHNTFVGKGDICQEFSDVAIASNGEIVAAGTGDRHGMLVWTTPGGEHAGWVGLEAPAGYQQETRGMTVDAANSIYTVLNRYDDFHVEDRACVVYKTATNGTQTWEAIVDPGQPGDMRPEGIALLPDGSLLVAGNLDAKNDVTWLARLDGETGSQLSFQVIAPPPATTDITLFDLAVDAAGGLVAVGVATPVDAIGDEQAWVQRWNPDGTVAWLRHPEGIGAIVRRVEIDTEGNVHIAGTLPYARDDHWGAPWVAKLSP